LYLRWRQVRTFACACGCGVFEGRHQFNDADRRGAHRVFGLDYQDQTRDWSGGSSAPGAK